MDADSRSRRDDPLDSDPVEPPAIAVTEGRPGVTVFLESDNTDGWIASDTTVEDLR